MRRRNGFTLVELLVVIGIIALLISILLPALNKARSQASLVADESNMRQVFSSVVFYANDYKGLLPRASWANQWGPQGTNCTTYDLLSGYLGKKVDPATELPQETLTKVFTCNEAVSQDGAASAWAPQLIRTLKFNPRAFPGVDQDPASGATGSSAYGCRKLSSIKNNAEKIALFEGPTLTGWNWCAEPEAINLDGWRWNWSHQFQDPPADGDYSRWSSPIGIGQNVDGNGYWSGGAMRFRHNLNSAAPVEFFDGHVDVRHWNNNTQQCDVLVKEFCINVAS